MNLLDVVLLDSILSGDSGGGDGCGIGCLGLISFLGLLCLGFGFVELLCPIFAHQLAFELLLCFPFFMHLGDLPKEDCDKGSANFMTSLLYYNALTGLVYVAFGDCSNSAMAYRNILVGVICGWLLLCACYKIHKKDYIEKVNYLFVSGKVIVLVCAIGVIIYRVVEHDLLTNEVFRSDSFQEGVNVFFKNIGDDMSSILDKTFWRFW